MGEMPGTAPDAALLELLMADARLSTAALARRLGVARSTVQGRLERLERNGVIRGYTVRLGPAATARQVQAHAMIAVEPQQQSLVERKLKAMPAVTSLLTVSGPYDLIAMLAAENTEALDAALDELRACLGVKSTTTSIVLSRRFER
ncbi:MAG TPA: Lrp/AsnC family transcriptional regulator [Steroidobacteraceae bacterium]|nr:Lrp/AsnC family transcriptional regulator [Steroidobacteraceae bacterium]